MKGLVAMKVQIIMTKTPCFSRNQILDIGLGNSHMYRKIDFNSDRYTHTHGKTYS